MNTSPTIPANRSGNTWALVLAAGEGSRLRSLTTTANGQAVPKQFCSLQGHASLLQDAMQRGMAVSGLSRTCVVVAEQHRCWWEVPLYHLPEQNVIVQPENRGTAWGILLPLLHIIERDPNATVVLLPADHYVRDEVILADSLRRAVRTVHSEPVDGGSGQIILLGMEPEQPDTELGYIVPEVIDSHALSKVVKFVEKPPMDRVRMLLDRGALWNVFIVVARAQALVDLYRARFADVLMEMQAVVHRDQGAVRDAMATFDLYQRLGSVDFSRDVLEGQESRLRVLPVPQCGWSDLGTPQRVAETLHRLPQEVFAEALRSHSGYLNLAMQHARHLARASVAQGVRS